MIAPSAFIIYFQKSSKEQNRWRKVPIADLHFQLELVGITPTVRSLMGQQ